jgi:hypothetical protein
MVIIVAISIAGSLLTYFFTNKVKWTAVKSSSLLSLFFACVSLILNYYVPYNHELYALCFFGASFVGMTTVPSFSYYWIGAAGIIYGLIFNGVFEYFSNIGGALGSTACISVIVVFLTQKAFNRYSNLKNKNSVQ